MTRFVILFTMLATFSISVDGQIQIGKKEHNILGIDTERLSKLLEADTVSTYFSLSDVTISQYFDEKGGFFKVGVLIPKNYKKVYVRNIKANSEVQFDFYARTCNLTIDATKGKFDFLLRNQDSVSATVWFGSDILALKIFGDKKTKATLRVRESTVKNVTLSGSQIQWFESIESSIENLTIEDSKFYPQFKPEIPDYRSMDYIGFDCMRSLCSNYLHFNSAIMNSKIESLNIRDTQFLNQDTLGSYTTDSTYLSFPITYTKISEAYFTNSRFQMLDFEGTAISRSIEFKNSEIEKLGVYAFDIPDKNLYLDFGGLQGKKLILSNYDIVVKDNISSVKSISGADSTIIKIVPSMWDEQGKVIMHDTLNISVLKSEPYLAKNSRDLLNRTLYYELINAYTKFMNAFKAKGDTESANLCYIEMKQIEGRRLQILYEQEKSLERYFAWQLNNFLNWFCDYGTNPVKSLVYAFYVIACFSLVYFLFPSEQDNLSRKSIYSFFGKAVEYFKTDKQLTQMHQAERQHEIDAMEKFSTTIRDSKGTVPPIVWYLGAPLYKMGITYNRFIIWIMAKSDIVKGRWEDIKPGKKIQLGALISLYFIGFLLTGFLMRIFNALALSLNAFVTLGYGEITAKGIARYLAVLEGVTGWFLLSIFSVSLISQILS